MSKRMIHILKTKWTALSLSLVALSFIVIGFTSSGCNIYKFNDASVPDSIKTIKVNFFENRATYVNPQLSQQLTDKVRQKIVSQTKLTQTNNDNADWIVNGTIINYSVTTSGISSQQEATNRLAVTVHIILNKQKEDKTEEYDVSRNFEFSASKSLQQAEGELATKIIKDMTDDIFNKLFSNW